MSITYRFFKVTNPEFLERVEEHRRINNTAKQEYQKIMAEIGASQYTTRNHAISAIVFDTPPDSKLFKKSKRVRNGYWPKKNSNAGKELLKRLETPVIMSDSYPLSVLNLSSSPCLFTGGYAYTVRITIIPLPTAGEIPEDSNITELPNTPFDAYVSVPWYQVDPEELKQYKIDRAAKTHFNSNYDHLLWEPVEGMEEIKQWQYAKAVNDFNESLLTPPPKRLSNAPI